MRRECRERFTRSRLQSTSLFSDPGMHHGMCVTHVSWCMSGSPIHGGGENVPGIPDACATRDLTYLARGPSIFAIRGMIYSLKKKMCAGRITKTCHADSKIYLCLRIIHFITKAFRTSLFHLHMILSNMCRPCQAIYAQSHQNLPIQGEL